METDNDGRNDFDFLAGNWIMHHRRLKERLKGCTEWEEFEGTAVGKKLLNGLGHCDEVIMDRETGPTHGYTLRLFDVHSKEWSIYWAAGNLIQLINPWFGLHLVVVALPPGWDDTAMVLIPAIVIADAGTFAARTIGRR